MNSIEKLLLEGLKENPEDWDIRLELVGKLVKSGDSDSAESILTESPVPPPDDDVLLKALQVIPEARASALTGIASDYIALHPSSAPAHYSLAQIYLSTGKKTQALEHYRVALAFDSSLRDKDLAQLMLDSKEDEALETSETQGKESKPAEEEEPLEITESEVAEDEDDEGNGDDDQDGDAIIPVALVHTDQSQKEKIPASPKTPQARATHTPSEKRALSDVVFTPDKGDGRKKESTYEETPSISENEIEDNQNVALIVGEGEVVEGQDKDAGTKEKVSALVVSILVHIGLALLLALIVIAVPRPQPPQLVVSSLPSVDEFEMDQRVIQKHKQTVAPPQAAAAQINTVNVMALSSVALPDVETESLDTVAIGLGNNFGMSMTLADENGAGMVSFFGSRSKAQKVVFVVDSSASMNAKGKKGKKSKHQLMKEELSKTLRVLPPTVEFQIIFFSGPAWFVGDKVPNSRDKKDDWHEWEGKNFWHYKDGEPEQLPVGKYIKATPSKVRRVIKQIEETPATYGTDWRAPLKMAIKMQPDIIYFMTDGAVGKHPKKEPVVKDVLDFNRKNSRAKINTICLMVPNATAMLAELAKKTRGEFTLVKEDGEVVRGKDIGKAK